MQHDYFPSFNQSDNCFLAPSLPLPLSLFKLLITGLRKISHDFSVSLWLIPFYQDNYSFQFDADDNSRCLSFPVLFFGFVLFGVFLYFSPAHKVGPMKVLTRSRHDCLETMKFE